MTAIKRHGTAVIVITLIVALLLTVLPLPEWARPFRPQWYTLALIYWVMALPQRVGVGSSWLLGITVDLLTESLFGLHALGLSIIAFIIIKLHQRIRVFPLWQQSLTVFLMLLLEQFLTSWILGFTGQPLPSPAYWSAPVVGMLLWPWLYVILRDIRRRFHVR
jgi:rod shape-determining protein MreD